MSSNSLRQERRLVLLILITQFFLSIILNTSQPLMPVIQRTFGISIAQSSVFPALISISVTIFTLIIGLLMNRIGRKNSLMYSFVLAMAGCLVIALSNSFGLFALGYALIGMSIGGGMATETTIYVGLSKYNFGLYHGAFGLGGICAPLILALWTGQGLDFRLLFLCYLFLFLFSVIMLLFTRIPMPEAALAAAAAAATEPATTTSAEPRASTARINLPLFALGIGILTSYAIVEVGSSTWASNMIINGYELANPSFILSGFWLLFTLSRAIIADRLARRLGAMKSIAILMALSFFIIFLWMMKIHPWLFLLLGLSFGPVLPIGQQYFNHLLPDRQRGLFNGMTYGGHGIGIMLFVPIMGLLGNRNMTLAYIPTLLITTVSIILCRRQYLQQGAPGTQGTPSTQRVSET